MLRVNFLRLFEHTARSQGENSSSQHEDACLARSSDSYRYVWEPGSKSRCKEHFRTDPRSWHSFWGQQERALRTTDFCRYPCHLSLDISHQTQSNPALPLSFSSIAPCSILPILATTSSITALSSATSTNSVLLTTLELTTSFFTVAAQFPHDLPLISPSLA